MSDTYYRYDDVRYAGGVDEYGNTIRGDGRTDIVLREYAVLKETPKGVWIDAYGRKFIRTNALKHWACWSKEAALHSFIARKEKQLRILTAQQDMVKDALAIAYKRLPSDPFNDMLAEELRANDHTQG
jgi:hypothetical protein